MDQNKWKKHGSLGPLQLDDCKKIVSVKGDTVIECVPKGMKELLFSENAPNQIANISVLINENTLKVEKVTLKKSYISMAQYKEIYSAPLVLENEKWKTAYAGRMNQIKKKEPCTDLEISKLEESFNKSPATIDSMFLKLFTGMTAKELFCISAKNGWFWDRETKLKMRPIPVIDKCNDSITILVPVDTYTISPQNNNTLKIKASVIGKNDGAWVLNLEKQIRRNGK